MDRMLKFCIIDTDYVIRREKLEVVRIIIIRRRREI